jgi:hypothetical protein
MLREKRVWVLRLALLLIPCVASPAVATGGGQSAYVAAVTDYVKADVQPWIDDPDLIAAIKSQNANFAGFNQADIDRYDREWRIEADNGGGPLIAEILSRRLSHRLKARQNESQGLISEIIVMDNHGLNVGLSAPTSDFWQGDEDKFTRTFSARSHSWFVGPPERDESTQMTEVQASMAIRDSKGIFIGAITIGIRLDAL